MCHDGDGGSSGRLGIARHGCLVVGRLRCLVRWAIEGVVLVGDRRTPDAIAGEQTRPVGLHVGVVQSQDGFEDLVLIEGSREALRFLAEILVALAEAEALPADFSMSPSGAGRFHLAETTTEALYINCVESDSASAVVGREV